MRHSKSNHLLHYVRVLVGSGKLTQDEGKRLTKELRLLVNAVNRKDRKDAIDKINSLVKVLTEMLV